MSLSKFAKNLVNVGLKIGDDVALTPDEVIRELERSGAKVKNYRIIDSASEPTVIAELDRPLAAAEGDSISKALKQDAIAQRTADGGELFGPKAEEWGPFNEDFFLDIDAPGAFPERKTSELAPREQGALDRFSAPRGEPASVPSLFADRNKTTLRDLAEQGVEQGADKWYHTGGIKDEFIGELGQERGPAAFDRFMDLKAATSPRSPVDMNLKRASILHQRSMAGESVDVGPEVFPKGYGHMAHSTAHRPGLRRLEETGQVGSGVDQPKVASYAENLKGNYQPVTVDTHNYQILSGQKKSPTAAQYPHLESRQQALAGEMGLDPAEFQSALWAGAGDITGVRNTQNVTGALNERIANTARKLGITESEAKARFIRGDTKLYQALGAGSLLGAGALAPEGEAEAAGFGRAAKFVKAAESAAGKARRGGQDSANALDLMNNQIERINKLGGRVISPQERQAAQDHVWGLYQKEMDRAGGEVARNVSEPTSELTEDLAGQFEGLYRTERPYTPEEEAIMGRSQMLERQMKEKPSLYHGNFGDKGQHFADPFEPKFYSQEGKHGEPVQIDPKDYKAQYGAAGGGVGVLAIGDDETDAGSAAAGSGVTESGGRVTGALDELAGWGEAYRQFGEDLIGGVLGGASAIGTLMMGGGDEQARANRDFWRGESESMSDDPSQDPGVIENWLARNPEVARKLGEVAQWIEPAFEPELQPKAVRPATYALESMFIY